MAYGNFKDLAERTDSDKVLKDKAFNVEKNPKYDGYQRGLASLVYKFFDKKPQVVVLIMKLNKIIYLQLISKLNKGTRFLLCVIDIFSKHAWVVPLKDKKRYKYFNAFQKILDFRF